MNVVVTLAEVGEDFLGLGVSGVRGGGDGLHACGSIPGNVLSGGPDADGFAVDGALVAELPCLLDDGARGELRLRGDVEGRRGWRRRSW